MADDEKDLSSEEDLSEDEYEEQDLSDSDVVTKYRMAADVVEVALQGVITQLKPGASLVEACEFGDKVIEGQTAGLFKNDKEMEKGLAFPTCLSVNECVCHFSPLTSESGDPLKVSIV
jgi:methionine aminopeptidase